MIHIHSPGGGRGSPLAREPERVRLDVQRGYVSVAAAEAEYGVVIDNGVIDVAATTTTRAAPHRRERGAHFDFGPEREVHEMLWTRENYGALTTILLALPVHWRFFVKSKIFELLPKQAARGDNRPRVHDAFAAVREAYPQVPGIDL